MIGNRWGILSESSEVTPPGGMVLGLWTYRRARRAPCPTRWAQPRGFHAQATEGCIIFYDEELVNVSSIDKGVRTIDLEQILYRTCSCIVVHLQLVQVNPQQNVTMIILMMFPSDSFYRYASKREGSSL